MRRKVEGRDLAVAASWHTRAVSYLETQAECTEHGMAEWLVNRMALLRGELDESGQRRAPLLAVFACLAAQPGQHERARAALRDLDDIAEPAVGRRMSRRERRRRTPARPPPSAP